MKLIHILFIITLLTLVGCGEKVDPETPVAELKQEAETLSVEELKAKASAYKDMIAESVKDLEPIKDKLMQTPLAEQMGTEAKALQDEIKILESDLSALKERLDVYVNALKAKGESVQQFLN